MIKADLKSFGCPMERFESYEKLKQYFNDGKKIALIMETPFRAGVAFENFNKLLQAEENRIEKSSFTFLNKNSGGMLICVHNDNQLQDFEGTIIY